MNRLSCLLGGVLLIGAALLAPDPAAAQVCGVNAQCFAQPVYGDVSHATMTPTTASGASQALGDFAAHDFNAEMFPGFHHDGVTDDTGAMQAALNAVSAAGGGTLHVGPYRYLLDSANLVIPSGVLLKGRDGSAGAAAGNDYSGALYALIVNPAYSVQLSSNSGIVGISELRKGLATVTDMRSALNAAPAFAGSGIIGGSSGAHINDALVRDVNVLGFATCYNFSWTSRLQMEHDLGDCTNGLAIDNSHDVSRIRDVHFNSFVTMNGPGTNQNWPVTGAADNGSGGIRLTTTAAASLQTGDTVWVVGVGGVTGANARWLVTVVDGSHLDLQGSTMAGAYTSGGTVYINPNRRTGAGFTVTNSDSVEIVNGFEVGWDTGWHLGSGASWNFCFACGADNDGVLKDTTTTAILVDGGASKNSWFGGYVAEYGTSLTVNSATASGFPNLAVVGTSLYGYVSNSLQLLQGTVLLNGAYIQGPANNIYIADAATAFSASGSDLGGAVFTYQSPADSAKVTVTGGPASQAQQFGNIFATTTSGLDSGDVGALVPAATASVDIGTNSLAWHSLHATHGYFSDATIPTAFMTNIDLTSSSSFRLAVFNQYGDRILQGTYDTSATAAGQIVNYPSTSAAKAGAPVVFRALGSDSNIAAEFLGTGTKGALTGVFSSATDPTTTDIPAGMCADWNNTTAASFKHVCNYGGTLRSVALN